MIKSVGNFYRSFGGVNFLSAKYMRIVNVRNYIDSRTDSAHDSVPGEGERRNPVF